MYVLIWNHRLDQLKGEDVAADTAAEGAAAEDPNRPPTVGLHELNGNQS
jgi:hypothetical protein